MSLPLVLLQRRGEVKLGLGNGLEKAEVTAADRLAEGDKAAAAEDEDKEEEEGRLEAG